MVCICSALQAPAQAFLRPAMWLPGIKRLHSHKEIWEYTGEVVQFADSLVASIHNIQEKDTSGFIYDIHTVSKSPDGKSAFLRIFSFTQAEWLDVVEISIKEDSAEAISFSSGLIPLCVPLAVFLNLVFFFVPFLDHGLNKQRLNMIRKNCVVPIQVVHPSGNKRD